MRTRWCVALCALVATASVSAHAAAQGLVVTLKGTEYEFQAPDGVPAGVTRVRLVNDGEENHQAQLVRLDAGRTIQDVRAWIRAGDLLHPPAWMTWMGGPGLVPRGSTNSTIVALRPGTYAWLCLTRSPPDMKQHVFKGMVRELTVVPGDGPQLPRLPQGDVLLLLSDYEFKLSQPLKAGHQTVRVRNNASQLHHVLFVRLHPGKTMDDFTAFVETREGRPPVDVIGAVANLDPQQVNLIDLDLSPGNYGMICFAIDAGDRRPHYQHGMVRSFTIRGSDE